MPIKGGGDYGDTTYWLKAAADDWNEKHRVGDKVLVAEPGKPEVESKLESAAQVGPLGARIVIRCVGIDHWVEIKHLKFPVRRKK